MMIESHYKMALEYVLTCCHTFSTDNFRSILSPNVELRHQTNRDQPIHASGVEAVTALFKKHLFDNTSDVDVKSIRLQPSRASTITLNLIVEENKTEKGKTVRYLFEETTIFKFSDSIHKIASIETFVRRRTPLSRL